MACCCGVRVPSIIITKANTKENLGEFICLSVTKATAKTNLHIFICNQFCVDGARATWRSFPSCFCCLLAKEVRHPQTCVYPDVCLGIAHVSGKAPLPGQGSRRYTMYLPFRPKESVGWKGQIHCVSTRPLVPGEGLYQIHGQSLNTHRGKHRSGGAQRRGCWWAREGEIRDGGNDDSGRTCRCWKQEHSLRLNGVEKRFSVRTQWKWFKTHQIRANPNVDGALPF